MEDFVHKFRVTLVRSVNSISVRNGKATSNDIDSSIVIEVMAEDTHDAALLAENRMGSSWKAVEIIIV